MATAIIAGLAAFGSTAGMTIGATTISVGTAAMIGVAAAGLTAAAEHYLSPDEPDAKTPDRVQLGDSAAPIDKTAIQKEAEIGKLQLGEEDSKRKKRKKGKAAFKIDLEKQPDTVKSGDVVGVKINKPEQHGVQI